MTKFLSLTSAVTLSDGKRVGSSARGGAHGGDMCCRASPWRLSPHLTGRSCRGWWRCRNLTKTDDLHVGRLSRRTSASRARSAPSTPGRPPPCWHNPMSSASPPAVQNTSPTRRISCSGNPVWDLREILGCIAGGGGGGTCPRQAAYSTCSLPPPHKE